MIKRQKKSKIFGESECRRFFVTSPRGMDRQQQNFCCELRKSRPVGYQVACVTERGNLQLGIKILHTLVSAGLVGAAVGEKGGMAELHVSSV